MALDGIKSHFPIFESNPDVVYLDTAATGQKPISVIEKELAFYRNYYGSVHRGVYGLRVKATDAYEAARETVQGFLNAALSDEIVFVKSATEGINLVARSFGGLLLGEGDEILLTEMEHHANIVPWQLMADERGFTIKVLPIFDNGELDIDQLKNLVSDKTKLISVTHVSNAIGTVNAVSDICVFASSRDIPVLVDGSQAIHHFPVDVQAIGCDFYVCSAHKCYGPTGIGALYMKKKWMDRLPPYQGGGDMIESVSFSKTTFAKGHMKFEAGTPNGAGAIGFAEAIRFLNDLSWQDIQTHERFLREMLESELRNMQDIRLVGESPSKVGVVSFNMDGVHSHDVGTILDHENICVRVGHHCAQPIMTRYGISGTVRVSFGLYNTVEDVERFLAALARVREVML